MAGHGIQPGLQRISKLLHHTKFPWKAIHVAGTNGKGTVCAYITAMLDVYNQSTYRKVTGHRPLNHARFTSPHLVHYFDGITLNARPVQTSVVQKVFAALKTRAEQERIGPSEFELLTATAFEVFSQSRADGSRMVDVAVIEVGMGGLEDATNIIGESHPEQDSRPSPLVTAFTKIGLDHQDFLGKTLAAIAGNKAGIMKPGVPVVYDGTNHDVVVEVLARKASENDCSIVRDDMYGGLDLWTAEQRAGGGISQHTAANLQVAMESTWTALQGLSRVPSKNSVSTDESQQYLRSLALDMLKVHQVTTFPGRLQRLSIKSLTGREASVLLDGAHNEQAAKVLAEAANLSRAQNRLGNNKIAWVIAASSTKDIGSILRHVLHQQDSVFAVEFGNVDGMPWVKPMSASHILAAAQDVAGLPARQCHNCGSDVVAALQAASGEAAEGPMVVAGSLYLVGDVLRSLPK